jgi:leucyl-tRNA synthetase
MSVDWPSIEDKWIKRWEEQKAFEANPDPARKKYFVTVAYPYPNSPQHIGHGRTYTLADAHARYMRMKGYNVLFPMGFHYTGTPILGMSRRVAAGDKDLLDTFHNVYKLTDDVIQTFVEPVKIASYFHNEIKQGMKEMGYSMDWRREFTTIDRMYSKFITWQFNTLKKKGLIVQGSHPVGWCPRDQNPVSQHDTMGDVEPDFTEYVLVKFRRGDLVIPAATLRPETIFGVINMWVNPDIEYVEASIDGEKWLVSKEAARKLEFLNHDVRIEKTVKGSEMAGWEITNPLNKAPIPVYPAVFVEADSGTGIVMSVPAHAPYDYQALADLKNDKELQKKYGLTVSVEPIVIIESEGYSSVPAAQAIEKAVPGPKEDKLEKATSDLYSHEFYKGRMLGNTGKYAGKPVAEAKNEVKEEMAKSGMTSAMYELNNPVRCRCGAECVVKLLSDQWFLNYGDKDWKTLAHECIQKMDVVPQDIRQEFDYVIDWLRERACARKSGLGTKLPWDQEWIIESLSDSVIYMAYYTIAKFVNAGAIPDVDSIGDSFFDYVLLGQRDAGSVARDCKIPKETVEQVRTEFSYFYPVDSRHSGRDLVPNHLSFFIFNHVAIFERKLWPGQVVVNGSVLMEGKKMSKSLGNIIPLRAAIKEHGADTIRLAMLVSAEILQDADFSFDTVRGIRSKLFGIFDMAEAVKNASAAAPEQVEDRWLASRISGMSRATAESMDRLRVREAIHNILYSLEQDLQWYEKRVSAKGRKNAPAALATLAQYLNAQIRMLAPFAPFTAEEVWERLGNKYAIAQAGWPEAGKIDQESEESEFLLQNLIADIQSIVKVTKMEPKKIVIYTRAAWKEPAYKTILSNVMQGKTNFGETMKQLIANPATAKVKTDPNIVKKMQEDVLSAPVEARERRLQMATFDEASAIRDGASLISKEFSGAEIMVNAEDDDNRHDPKGKAKFARPFKPAVYME